MALANREIGALPPSAKAEAGKRVGQAWGEVAQALKTRQAELEAERDARILVEEAQDLTVLAPRRRLGARHPVSLVTERVEDIFVAMGWEIAEGPEVESEWLNFDALNLGADHPARQMQDTFVDPPRPASSCAPTPRRSRCAPCSTTSRPSTCCAPARCSAPTSSTPRTPRCSTSSRASSSTRASPWPTSGAASTPSCPASSERARSRACAPPTSPSPSPAPRSTAAAGSARARTPVPHLWRHGMDRAGGCGMVNRRVLTASGIDPDRYTGFAFGLGIERSLMLRHGVGDMHDIVEGDVRFSTQFGMEI